MSKETSEWLNTMTLIGFTAKRGNAWHYAEALQGAEPNHYVGSIPVEDVLRRLFDWEAQSRTLYVRGTGGFVEVPDRQAIVASDDDTVLGVFKSGYQPHQYREWLVDNVASILNGDTDLGIGSAGLLRNRGQAWVSVEVPESMSIDGTGIEYRPNLIACTSFDGTLATTYKRTVTNVVCDNTLAAGLSESGMRYKLKHTKNSGMRIEDAKAALSIIEGISDAFEVEVRRLLEWTVDIDQWAATLDALVPTKDADGKTLEGRGATLAEHKRDTLETLYANDNRVSPWAGTAFGVLQAFNTYTHHYGTIRGDASKVQRNHEYVLSGKMAALDTATLDALTLATASN